MCIKLKPKKVSFTSKHQLSWSSCGRAAEPWSFWLHPLHISTKAPWEWRWPFGGSHLFAFLPLFAPLFSPLPFGISNEVSDIALGLASLATSLKNLWDSSDTSVAAKAGAQFVSRPVCTGDVVGELASFLVKYFGLIIW